MSQGYFSLFTPKLCFFQDFMAFSFLSLPHTLQGHSFIYVLFYFCLLIQLCVCVHAFCYISVLRRAGALVFLFLFLFFASGYQSLQKSLTTERESGIQPVCV